MSWLALSLLLLGAALAAGFAWYERSHPTAHVLALIATLAALAALGRIAFAPIPNVKPTTDIILICGYVLGGAPGFAVGAITALASNLFFGQGPWTPWQMAGWGLVGIGGAVLATLTGRRLGRIGLSTACFAAGLMFGAVMNFSLWITYSGDHTLAKLGGYFATSLPWDLAHATGNALFCLAFGPALVAALGRYRRRFEVVWKPAVAAAGVLLVLVAPAALASAPQRSVGYLERAQNSDGGWGPEPNRASTGLHTAWAALGLAAAGRDPARGGALRYLRRNARDVSDLGEISRTVLVLRAAGRNPRRFAGRDLVRALVRKQRDDGSFAGRINTTSFALLALRAAGRSRSDARVRTAAGWVAGQANRDGGFNFARRGGASGVDDTAAAIQALVAAGRRKSGQVRRGAAFLARQRSGSGGFPLTPGGPANAQSTAWAVQALIAARRHPKIVRHAQSHLRSLVERNGAVRYSRTSRQTPVWVTGQALTALAGKAFPLKPIRRSRKARTTAEKSPAPAPEKATSPRPARSRRGAAALVTPGSAARLLGGLVALFL